MHTDRWALVLCAGILVASSAALAFGPRRPDAPRIAFNAAQPFARSRAVPASADAIAAAAADPSDRALAEYALAARHLERGELSEAKALLKEARNRPLVVDPASGGSAAPDDISAASQLLLVTTHLTRAAIARAEQGDGAGAAALLRSAREVAAHVLETEQPTLEGLLAARSVDAKTGRAEAKVQRLLGREAAARRIESRERALKAFYDREVMTRVVALRDARETILVAAITRGESEPERRAALGRQDRRDDAAARELIESYQAERTRLLS